MQNNNDKVNFANGSEKELEAVIKQYSPALLRYCHSILCDYHEAQDALQMTFIKAYNNRASFKGSMPLAPWLYKIAYTTCIDMLRKKKLALIFSEPAQTNDESAEYIPENIREALMSLSASDRALVFSRAMEEKSYEELAVIYSKSSAALRKRYERARKKLVAMLADDYPYYVKQEVKNEQEL